MELKHKSVFVTLYGEHLGYPAYFLVCEESVFALSLGDAVRACEKGEDFIPASLLNDEERTRIWDAWKASRFVLGTFEDEDA